MPISNLQAIPRLLPSRSRKILAGMSDAERYKMKYYFAIVGIIFGVFGVIVLIRCLHLYLVGIRALGMFSKWEIRGFRHPAHHPVVRFTAQDGNNYEITSLAGRRPQPKIKERYAVIYPLSAPQEGLVYSLVAYWPAPFGFFLLSFAALYAAYDLHR